ncbi:hypothetical protein HDU96_004942 [Phlyctochytrium bullatum]|nr:hypothetical protein HDU96_004942 [Phlyctochytrium bullatum]
MDPTSGQNSHGGRSPLAGAGTDIFRGGTAAAGSHGELASENMAGADPRGRRIGDGLPAVAPGLVAIPEGRPLNPSPSLTSLHSTTHASNHHGYGSRRPSEESLHSIHSAHSFQSPSVRRSVTQQQQSAGGSPIPPRKGSMNAEAIMQAVASGGHHPPVPAGNQQAQMAFFQQQQIALESAASAYLQQQQQPAYNPLSSLPQNPSLSQAMAAVAALQQAPMSAHQHLHHLHPSDDAPGPIHRENSVSSSVNSDSDDNRNSFNIFASNRNHTRTGGLQTSPEQEVQGKHRIGHRGPVEIPPAVHVSTAVVPDEENTVEDDDYQYYDDYNPYTNTRVPLRRSEDDSDDHYPSFTRSYTEPRLHENHDDGEDSEEDDAFLLQYQNNLHRGTDFEEILGGYDEVPPSDPPSDVVAPDFGGTLPQTSIESDATGNLHSTEPFDAATDTYLEQSAPLKPPPRTYSQRAAKDVKDAREADAAKSASPKNPSYSLKRFSFEAHDEEMYLYHDKTDPPADLSGAASGLVPAQPSEGLPDYGGDDGKLVADQNDSGYVAPTYAGGRRKSRPSLPTLVTNTNDVGGPKSEGSQRSQSSERSNGSIATAPHSNSSLKFDPPTSVVGAGGSVVAATAPVAPPVQNLAYLRGGGGAGSASTTGSGGGSSGFHTPRSLAESYTSSPLSQGHSSPAMLAANGFGTPVSTPTSGAAPISAAFPSRGSSHVIQQHLARTNSTARGGPSDRKAIREALAAAKKLTSSGQLTYSDSPPLPPTPPQALKSGGDASPLLTGRSKPLPSNLEALRSLGSDEVPMSAPAHSNLHHAPYVPYPLATAASKAMPRDQASAPHADKSALPYSNPKLPTPPPPTPPPKHLYGDYHHPGPSGSPPPLPPRDPEPTIQDIEELLDKGTRLLLQPPPSEVASPPSGVPGSSHRSTRAKTSDLFEAALFCWREAVRMSQTLGDSFREARALNNLGCALRRAGREQEAWESLDRALGLAVTALDAAITRTGENPHDDVAGQAEIAAFVDFAPFDEADEVPDDDHDLDFIDDEAASRKPKVDTREMARRRRLQRVLLALQVSLPATRAGALQTPYWPSAPALASASNPGSNKTSATSSPKVDPKKMPSTPPNAAQKALKLLGVQDKSNDRNDRGNASGAGVERSNSVSVLNSGSTLERKQTWSGSGRPSLSQKKSAPGGLLEIDPNLMGLIPGVRLDKLGGALSFAQDAVGQVMGASNRGNFGQNQRKKSLPTQPVDRLRQIGPPIYVLCMDICTSIGNAHFAEGKFLNALTWHQSCLDIAQDTFAKWPLPVRPEPAVTESGSAGARPEVTMKLSYLHRSAILARSRSFSHLGLCLQRLGEPHRAVKFHQRAITSLNVAGPQTQLNAPLVRASLVGNLAGAQFAVGRLPEAARGLADSVRRFAGCSDRLGLARATMNAAACWIEAGRLGLTVSSVGGSEGEAAFETVARKKAPTAEAVDASRAANTSNIYVPMRKASIATMMSELGASGYGNSQPPGLKTLQRAASAAAPPGIDTIRRVITNTSAAASGAPASASSASLKTAFSSISSAGGSTSGVTIPPRLHSVTVVKERPSHHAALAARFDQAKEEGPEWLVDLLGALKLLWTCVDESRAVRDVECEGLARFNIAAVLILLRLPGKASRVFESFSGIDWSELLIRGYSPRMAPKTSSDTITWRGPEPSAVFFNLIQLFFVASLSYLDATRSGSTWELPNAEMAALQSLSKSVMKLVTPGFQSPTAVAAAAAMSPPTSPISPQGSISNGFPLIVGNSNKPGSTPGMTASATPPIDAGVLISALKKCLEWFDGSELGPSTTKKPNLLLPGSKYEPMLKKRGPSNNPDAPPPWSSLPSSTRPHGPTTSGTTRVCLALSRTLIVVFSTQAAPRRVAMARDEARRWAGVEASIGLNNAATAAAASRRSKSRSTVVAGSGLDALLISAVAETGEVHGTLSLEVGAVACDLEQMAAKKWILEDHTAAQGLAEGQSTVQKLVKLAAKKVRTEVIRRVREEQGRLESLLDHFTLSH